jgi:hypothetical protein
MYAKQDPDPGLAARKQRKQETEIKQKGKKARWF